MDYHLRTEHTFQGPRGSGEPTQAQEDKARVHLGENPPAEALLMTLKTFSLFPEACCRKWEYLPFAQERLPWSWGEQSQLLHGGGGSALVWS